MVMRMGMGLGMEMMRIGFVKFVKGWMNERMRVYDDYDDYDDVLKNKRKLINQTKPNKHRAAHQQLKSKAKKREREQAVPR